MIASTAARFLPAAALAAALSVALTGLASAQSGPVQLLKKRQPDRATPPPVEQPSSARPEMRAPSGVTVRRLGVVDPESVGIITSSQGGLGAGMWGMTSRARIIALLESLPDRHVSPALRDLQSRLLLTTATVPSGEGGSILEVRAQKLAALGDMESVERLVRAAPDANNNEVLERLLAETALVSPDPQTACANAENQANRYGGRFWQRLDIYCRIGLQDRAGAMLGLDVLRESVGVTAFLKAAEAHLAGASQPDIRETDLDILDVVMLIAGGYGLPPEAVENLPTAVLPALAMADAVPMDVRLLAAERAVAAGVLDPAGLQRIYGFIGFGTTEMTDPVTASRNMEPARARALLYQASGRQGLDAARAELMRAALATAKSGWQYLVVARAFHPVVTAIGPTPTLNWFAPFAVASLLTAGDVASAENWVRLMEANAPVSEEAAVLAHDLRPLIWIAQKPSPQPRIVAELFPGEEVNADLSVRARLLPLLEAVGVETPGESWTPLLDWMMGETVEIAPPHIVAALRRAARDGHVAEVAVLALKLLGEHGPAGSSGQAVVVAAEALASVGLEQDARAIALEAAVAGIGAGG
jgi:hypothetical protein